MRVGDPQVLGLIEALTRELAGGGDTAAQTFGYSPADLERADVYLVGALVGGQPVGLGGVELQEGGAAELKRFYVVPEQRGAGVADALVSELTRYAAAHDAEVLQLETGDQQRAAIAFYRRHGFVEVPPFGPYVGSETSICMRRRLARP